ncbi:MAG: hypothetical protein DHS20C05_02540 [Hyphococcus sp.]|nr:MAG: hypothetical protein DHS20C05_02540 [Marinicaulis sp.]
MTTQSTEMTNAETKVKPTHRVSFARITGTDDQGNDQCGSAREIGAIWPRKGDKKGGILKLDHIPVELTKHQGVLFVVSVTE